MDTIMKKIFVFAMMAMAALAVSCNEKVEPDIPHGPEYDQLYLVQASAGATQEVNLLSSQESWTTNISAFYSGLSVPVDVNITFKVDNSLIDKYNEEHSTSCIPLPDGSYTIGSPRVKIKTGDFRTSLIPIEIDVTKLEPELENPYLMPFTMNVAEKDITVNEKLKTIYYVVKVNKDRTPIVLEGNVEECDEFFSFHDKCILTRNRATGVINRYVFDPEAKTLEGPTMIRSDWPSSVIAWMQAGNGHTLQIVNTGMSWFSLPCSEDGSEISDFSAMTLVTGGCGIFMDSMICEAPGDGYLNIWGGSGMSAFYPMADNGITLLGASHAPCPAGNLATDFVVRFLYKHDLFCIDKEGNLWQYVWDPNSLLFKSRSQVGSGWGQFKSVTSYGDEFLMLLPDGTVKSIEWDPTVFWAFSE